MRFMARASQHGLCVSKPWGDSSAYDFIIEHKGKLLRVQVKSTTHARYHSYVCCFHGHKNRRYTAEEIDFVAAYIIPKDIWFIFPIAVILKVHSSRDSVAAHESFQVWTVSGGLAPVARGGGSTV